jgi:uncharacterized membrane protein YebE (DUF533 family)
MNTFEHKNNSNPDKQKPAPTSGFSQYIQKVQKELSDDYLIEVYVSLYLQSLQADGALNYEEKVWFADRVKELYDIDIFKPIHDAYTMEEFLAKAKAVANAPLTLEKIAAYFTKIKKIELCYELACFATYTGDREIESKETQFLQKLAEALQIPETKKIEIQSRFESN